MIPLLAILIANISTIISVQGLVSLDPLWYDNCRDSVKYVSISFVSVLVIVIL